MMSNEPALSPLCLSVDPVGRGASVTLTPLPMEDGVAYYRILWEAPEPIIPARVCLRLRLAKTDIVFSWQPNDKFGRHLRPDWWPVTSYARSASGAPLLSLLGKEDQNRCTVALSDGKTPTCLSAGTREENACVILCVTLFTEVISPIERYEVLLRVDRRPLPASRVIADVGAWWRGFYPPAPASPFAFSPMYSTWYSMHQELSSEAVLRQCRLAKTYGMDTVILDDGWQTGDNNRGYAYCGDWEVYPGKIPDMKALVASLHALGMKAMLWLAVPYAGFFSRAAKALAGKFLYKDEHQKAYVLDPRYREVRDYLKTTYLSFAKRYDLDGFKLDFIDAFSLSEEAARPAAGREELSLEDAVERLLSDITQALRAEKPDFLIEFRQSYTGPVMQQYGNMLRVSDCPGDALVNRMGTVDLRLVAGPLAVHADPLLWHPEERAEDAALQLAHTLFAVPQISVDLDTLPDEQRAMLAYYLAYQRENRAILWQAPLSAHGFSNNYTAVTASGPTKDITVLYDRIVWPVCPDRALDLVNASACRGAVLRLDGERTLQWEVRDCCGRQLCQEEKKLSGLVSFDVPVSGFLFLRFPDEEK